MRILLVVIFLVGVGCKKVDDKQALKGVTYEDIATRTTNDCPQMDSIEYGHIGATQKNLDSRYSPAWRDCEVATKEIYQKACDVALQRMQQYVKVACRCGEE